MTEKPGYGAKHEILTEAELAHIRANTVSLDLAEYLTEPDDQAELLAGAMETDDPAIIAETIGLVARARGISKLARQTGLTRPTFYGAFSKKGNPNLSTLLATLKALGFGLSVRRLMAASGKPVG